MKKFLFPLALAPLLLTLAGCMKTFDMVSTEFPQATHHEPSYATIKDSLRSVTLYDGFETRAHFDILWLSDNMRSLFSSLRSAKLGHNPAERDAFLARQLEENNHWLSFYILSEVYDDAHVSLTDQNSEWSFFVELSNGTKLKPLSIKEVDLEPEIKFVYGHRFALYKKAYRVNFGAKDLSGNLHVRSGDKVRVVCAAPGLSSSVSWVAPQMRKRAELQKEHALQEAARSTWLGFLKDMAKGKQQDEDFYW